jgi:hypothetical protein
MSQVPDFTRIDFADSPPPDSPMPVAAGSDWLTPEEIAVKERYSADDLKGLDYVRHPAVDHPPICRIFHGRRLQRFLPA